MKVYFLKGLDFFGCNLTCLDPVPSSICARNAQRINCDVTTWSWVNLVNPGHGEVTVWSRDRSVVTGSLCGHDAGHGVVVWSRRGSRGRSVVTARVTGSQCGSSVFTGALCDHRGIV